MGKIHDTSVENFIKELNTRVNLLNSNTTRANINEDNYNKLNHIIKSYINRPSNTLTTTDIVDFREKDIKDILYIIGLDEDSIDNILKDFNSSVKNFKDTLSQKKLIEATKYFEEIRKMIDIYLNDYIEINDNKNDTFNKTINEYKRYIELFENESFAELFDDIDNISKLMNNLAIPTEDKWKILKYIASQNIKYSNHQIIDINLAKKVYDIVSRYLAKGTSAEKNIQKALEKTGIDIDLIPYISLEIANELNLSEEYVKNIICALVANGLFEYYTKSITNNEEELVESTRIMIEDVLKFYVKEENEIIKEARKVLENNEDFYNEHKNKKDILDYLDMSINEITNEEITHDMAVDLKTLPIIKTISETLDKIERLSEDSPDYDLCCGILNDLVEAYNNLLLKKQSVGLRRINGS